MPKRETIGQRLKRARESLGLSADRLSEKILKEYGAKVSQTAILTTEADRAPNAGRKTIEYMSLGVGLDPLEVFAIGLDHPPIRDTEAETETAQQIRSRLKQVRPEKKSFADEAIRVLIKLLDEYRKK